MPKAPESQEEFDRQLAKEQEEGFRARMTREPGIGVLPDGTLNIVNPHDPPFRPKVIDADGNEIDPSTIE